MRTKNTGEVVARKQPGNIDKGMKVCGGKSRIRPGDICANVAGAGTEHLGYGKCKWHGGSMPNGIKAAEKEMIEERMAKEGARYGALRDIGPHEALLEEVQRTAGHVVWLQEKVRSLDSDDDLTQYTGKDGMKQSEWISMYQTERQMLVTVCNVAIRAGIAERQVRLAEDQGRMIAAIFVKFINDERLALSPEQRVYAPKLARMLMLDPSQEERPRFVGNEEVVDAVVVEPENSEPTF